MKTFKLLLLFLVVFFVTAIYLVPMHFAKPHIEKNVPNLTLGNVKGTIWSGSADNMIYHRYPLGQVNWKFNLLNSLKKISLNADVNVIGQLNLTGNAGVNLKKTVTLSDMTFNTSAKVVNQFITLAQLDGEISGELKKATIIEKQIPLINGTAVWKNAVVDSAISLPKGDYYAEFNPKNEQQKVTINSKDNPININGTALLSNDWSYTSDFNLQSDNTKYQNLIRFLGKPQTDGSVNVSNNGSLATTPIK